MAESLLQSIEDDYVSINHKPYNKLLLFDVFNADGFTGWELIDSPTNTKIDGFS